MTKPRTAEEFYSLTAADFTWRLRELSDLKLALSTSSGVSRPVLFRSLVVMCYAHWEGHAKYCGERFIEYLTMRRLKFSEIHARYYDVRFFHEMGAASQKGCIDRAKLVEKIRTSRDDRFSHFPREMIDTRSNLNSEVLEDLCFVCGVDYSVFLNDIDFIDRILLKRRNEVAHGQASFTSAVDQDELVDRTTKIMRTLRDRLENCVALQTYRI